MLAEEKGFELSDHVSSFSFLPSCPTQSYNQDL